jgi:hypothetical protein
LSPRQHIRAGIDLYRLRRGRVMTIAMAICFAVSIPLYLVIGQGAFVLWAVVPIGTSLILRVSDQGQQRGLEPLL